MENYENLCRELEAELKLLDTKYATKHGMEKQDVELAKMLFSALDHKASFIMKKEALEMQEEQGKNWTESNSFARGRNRYNGQYMSRAMGDEMSGHWPIYARRMYGPSYGYYPDQYPEY